ncbi:uncharacterized protein [Chiloscyllium punctatum]|uniref:Brain abundant membrane attached signal protein 1 n=1 Tax=Chiloscyllium punctatum TaxID=137246 RepID=A0A401RKN3_CHIPU|nr:hypothetical protein [Chiloscyllium punctatum]
MGNALNRKKKNYKLSSDKDADKLAEGTAAEDGEAKKEKQEEAKTSEEGGNVSEAKDSQAANNTAETKEEDKETVKKEETQKPEAEKPQDSTEAKTEPLSTEPTAEKPTEQTEVAPMSSSADGQSSAVPESSTEVTSSQPSETLTPAPESKTEEKCSSMVEVEAKQTEVASTLVAQEESKKAEPQNLDSASSTTDDVSSQETPAVDAPISTPAVPEVSDSATPADVTTSENSSAITDQTLAAQE